MKVTSTKTITLSVEDAKTIIREHLKKYFSSDADVTVSFHVENVAVDSRFGEGYDYRATSVILTGKTELDLNQEPPVGCQSVRDGAWR